MQIKYADKDDLTLIINYDKHISKDNLLNSINAKRTIIIKKDNCFCGWLRYNLFWDNTPFLNMLYLLEDYQNIGLGTKLLLFWEKEMYNKGYKLLMTSSLSNEKAQHFFRKHGYIDSGSLLLENEPLEIIFIKTINN